MRRVPRDHCADSRDVFLLEKLWRPVHESQHASMLQEDGLPMSSEACFIVITPLGQKPATGGVSSFGDREKIKSRIMYTVATTRTRSSKRVVVLAVESHVATKRQTK